MKMPIYTKSGDAGETGLFGGKRVKKSADVIKVLGELDELNAFLGLARLSLTEKDSKKISQIQSDLFIVGSVIAGAQFTGKNRRYLDKQVSLMEECINDLNSELPLLRNFISPNGCESSVRVHLARAICRRCERSLMSLGKHISLVPYINRLSDYLFILARYENHRRKVKEEAVNLIPQ